MVPECAHHRWSRIVSGCRSSGWSEESCGSLALCLLCICLLLAREQNTAARCAPVADIVEHALHDGRMCCWVCDELVAIAAIEARRSQSRVVCQASDGSLNTNTCLSSSSASNVHTQPSEISPQHQFWPSATIAGSENSLQTPPQSRVKLIQQARMLTCYSCLIRRDPSQYHLYESSMWFTPA